MSQDLSSILTGEPTKTAPVTVAPVQATIYKDPIEAAIRTVYAENPRATPEERRAIASVIANRAKATGKSVGDIVQEPHQFTPWEDENGRKRIDGLKRDSADYVGLMNDVGGILSGKDKPTVDSTHYYSPSGMVLGADGLPTKPKWDDGTGKQIGAHTFFTKPYGSNDLAVLAGSSGDMTQEDAEAAFNATFGNTGDGPKLTSATTPFKFDPGESINPAQQKTRDTLNRGGALDPEAPDGSLNNAVYLRKGQTEHDNVEPGQFYVGLDGKLARKPGGDKESSAMAGLGQGLLDIPTSIGEMLPGNADSAWLANLKANQLQYGAQYGGDTKSGLGRFTGQLVASAVPMAGAEGLAMRAAPGLFAPAAGWGGRAAQLVGQGAAEGAGGAALTSSANEGSLPEQMLAGAAGGALFAPAIPAVTGLGRFAGDTARELFEPLTGKGRGRIADRIITEFGRDGPMAVNGDEIIPGSVPTLAMATANPGIATLERTVRLARPTPFAERGAQNAEARTAALDTVRGDEHTVAGLVEARNRVLDGARDRAFASTTDADVQPLVSAIDAALEAPEAHQEVVARTLQGLRDKVVTPPADTTPAQRATFNRAVAATFGSDAPALTPEVMSEARSRLGAKFEEIAGKTQVAWDDTLRGDIGQVLQDVAQVVPEGSMPPLFRQLDNIASTANDGKTISGASYQALTKKGAPLDSLMNSADPTIRNAAGRIREALDDALERSLGDTDPAVLTDLQNTRLQYKNLKTAEAALKQAGPDKQVTPQAVMSAVKRNFGQFAYQGGGGLGDAAEAALREEAGRAPTVATDPRQIYGMRQSLSDAIDKLDAQGTDPAREAANRLRSVQEAMDASIESGAPGYRDFVSVRDRSAEPIEATKFLQSLRITDSTGKPTLGRVDSAIKRITDMRQRDGKNPAKLVSEATLAQLEAIRDDLMRENNINLGRAIGPDTAQHFVTSGIASKMNVPLMLGLGASGHPAVGAALGLGKLFYGMKNEQVLDALASRLLQPELRAPPLHPVSPTPRLKLPLVGPAAGILSGRMVGQ